MSSIAKECIELFIKNPLENGLTRGEQMELARIALASLESVAAQAVPDELANKSFEYIADKFQVSISDAQWILVGWNACRDAMLQCSEPETDNTNQQFESLSRGNK